MFVDSAKIYVKAGDGGDGAVSFHREKYVAAGGPDGGDGGKGGDIVFKVDNNLSSLIDFSYKRKYVAQKGENGSAKNSSGRGADDRATSLWSLQEAARAVAETLILRHLQGRYQSLQSRVSGAMNMSFCLNSSSSLMWDLSVSRTLESQR